MGHMSICILYIKYTPCLPVKIAIIHVSLIFLIRVSKVCIRLNLDIIDFGKCGELVRKFHAHFIICFFLSHSCQCYYLFIYFPETNHKCMRFHCCFPALSGSSAFLSVATPSGSVWTCIRDEPANGLIAFKPIPAGALSLEGG